MVFWYDGARMRAMCTSRSLVYWMLPMSWLSWFLKFSLPLGVIMKLCSSTMAMPCRTMYPAKERLDCVRVRAADSYGTRDAMPSSKFQTFHLILPSTSSLYRYGRILVVKGELVPSVMRPSILSVSQGLGPCRMSGRCQRPWRLKRCRSVLMSRADGPKKFS